MENQDRLDEFFQDKFANDDPHLRFAFQEEFWLQAQALIEANEKRSKRRFFWWWLTGAGVLALLLAGWFWLGADPFHPAPAAGSTRSETTAPGGHISASEPKPPTGNRAAAEAAGTAEMPEAATAAVSPDAPAGTGRQPVSPPAGANHSAGTGSADTARPPHDAPARASLTRATPVTENNPAETGHRQNDNPNLQPKAGTPLPPAPIDPLPPSTETSGKPAENPLPATQPSALPGEGPQGIPAPIRRRPALELLPLPLLMLQRPAVPAPVPTRPAMPPVALTEPLREWQWSAGIVAAAGTATGRLEQEATGICGGLSLRLERRSSPWSANVDLLWRWQKGGIVSGYNQPGPLPSLRYSFGYVADELDLRVTGIHQLEAPVSIQYRWRQLRAEAGLAPVLLLYLQAREEHLRSESLEPDPRVLDARRTQAPNLYFKNTGLAGFAGVEWQPFRRLALGTRLQYRKGGGQSYDGEVLTTPAPWSAGVQLRYFFCTP